MVENIAAYEMSDEDVQVFHRLAEAINEMGWNIAVDTRGKDQVRGMIIGTLEYIEEIMEKVEMSEN